MGYNIITEQEEYTVVSEYSTEYKKLDKYQSEAALEKDFIKALTEQGYEYLPIHKEDDLVENLRVQLQRLNNYTFTDAEWERFFRENLANKNDDIVAKTTKIQEDYIQVLKCDSGESKNIYLIDKKNIHNNFVQVINQYEAPSLPPPTGEGPKYSNRYDVSILVNGLPLVHVELKRRGVQLKEAFNQINRYQRDSFWAGCGLYEYVQIFIISNGTNTKYYSNTTRANHLKEQQGATKGKTKKASNSFEFSSFWTDSNNKPILDLIDFTKTFLSKHTLLNVLTKYCIFTTEKMLMVMRPYQIAATERIIQRINIANNYKQWGKIEGGGYIWHTTGSGKTLTSFKTAQLASRLDFIDKVLFVVDRKDLDYQTMKEYNRFEEGAADSNSSTAVLQRQLEDRDKSGAYHHYKIIITTIQKLSIFVQKNKGHEVFNKRIVFIFDECHRSNFGDMHIAITKNFKKYHLFGFTGTPIFAANAGTGGNIKLKTTQQASGDKLHTYTIVDAINDENVLPFRIDYVNTLKQKDGIVDKQVSAIDREKVMSAPERVSEVVKYILEHFDQKTKRSSYYSFRATQNIGEVASAGKGKEVKEQKLSQKLAGFNAMFAVASIPMAKAYYNEFKKQQASLPEAQKLKIATIYSYGANEEEIDGILAEENPESTTSLDQQSRDFLEGAIKDYNQMFSTNYDTSNDKFQNYYKDLSLRMKNRQVDLLIIVNMFLTGFDATTLNTLFVDKNLKQHGLIQGYSRTNRILNSIKTFGNIVCFRNLQKETDDAIALFGDKDASSIVLLKDFLSYYEGYDNIKGKHCYGYKELVEQLQEEFPDGKPAMGEQAERRFIGLFGSLLKSINILQSFDQFEGKELLTDGEMQDYQSHYLDLKEKWRPKHPSDKEVINDDLIFETELIRQVEINIDYILMLVKEYHNSNCKNKELLVNISKAIGASMQLRSKKDLIESFIAQVNAEEDVDGAWEQYVKQKKEEDLVSIINEEKLKPEETRKFIDNAFRDGQVRTTGTDIDKILPPMSRFGGGGNRTTKKQTVIEKITAFFERYLGL
ncbi:MAG: type I restriction endonuclease subunit R [Bacteroidales bacterium]|nr:type I restriction endonuclease subunit R [Candidatus Sodaliphilus limicaballi]